MGDLRNIIDNKSFANGASSKEYLEQNEKKLEWSIELYQGLTYMHEKNIVHRDVNPKYNFI